MRGRDDEIVAVPRAGREAAPRVQCVGGGMPPPVHPDGGLLLLLVDGTVIRDDLLRLAIDVGPDAHLREDGFERVVPGVRPARPLGDAEGLRRPAAGPPPPRAASRRTGPV